MAITQQKTRIVVIRISAVGSAIAYTLLLCHRMDVDEHCIVSRNIVKKPHLLNLNNPEKEQLHLSVNTRKMLFNPHIFLKLI